MLDEVIAKTHPANWGAILRLSRDLISTVGKVGINHVIVDPVESFKKLVSKLEGQSFSAIIDLSSWIGYGLEPLFPHVQLISDFSLSRIRDISTPELKTTGYTLTMSRGEITKRAAEIDLSKVLIIDDTSFTGETNELVMKLWGIEPSNATHAFLVANIGVFPSAHLEQSRLGAVRELEILGSKVIYGDELTTPDDDAWHICDLFDHPELEKALPLALQTIGGTRTTQEDEELFLRLMTRDNLLDMTTEGRFIPNSYYVGLDTAMFSSNPLLWASAKLFKYVDKTAVFSNKEEVLTILKQMRALASNAEGMIEIRNALRNEARLILKGGIKAG